MMKSVTETVWGKLSLRNILAFYRKRTGGGLIQHTAHLVSSLIPCGWQVPLFLHTPISPAVIPFGIHPRVTLLWQHLMRWHINNKTQTHDLHTTSVRTDGSCRASASRVTSSSLASNLRHFCHLFPLAPVAKTKRCLMSLTSLPSASPNIRECVSELSLCY